MKKITHWRGLVGLLWLGTGTTAALGQVAEAPRVEAPQVPTVEAPKPNPWEKTIQKFEERDKIQPPKEDAALFVGSSSISGWGSLAKDFSEIPVINRGFGGSQLSDSAFFAERIVLPYKPRMVVVYAGGNDIGGGKSAEQVAQSFRDLVAVIHKTRPQTPVVFISLNPTIRRWKDDATIREANRLIENWTKTTPQTAFIDSYSGLLGADGKPQANLLKSDGLHLNADGYKAWVAIMKPRLLKMYEDARPQVKP